MQIRLRNAIHNTDTNTTSHYSSINKAKKIMRQIPLKDKRALWSPRPKTAVDKMLEIESNFILKRAKQEGIL